MTQRREAAETTAEKADKSEKTINEIAKSSLHDKDIREPLFDFLEQEYGMVRIIEEKVMGKSRADVVMILKEAVVGIEIKSDADTYTRLAGQVKDYDKFFDMNICVVGTRHAAHIEEHVPDYWGIITVEEVDEYPDFYVLRKPKKNPKMDLKKKLSILWRPEMAQLQEMNRLPKYKEKSKTFVIEKLAGLVPDILSEEKLAEQISDRLFERDYSKVEETLMEYRRSETSKLLEKTSDPAEQIELMMNAAAARCNLKVRSKRKKRRKI